MPRKDYLERKQYNKGYNKRYYAKNKDKEKKRIKTHKRNILLWWREYKKQFSCVKCGENNPACIDFHHKGTKKIEMASITRDGYSKESILEELKRCVSLCANCHRKLHSKD